MKRLHLFLACLLLICYSSYAQYTLSGKVIDLETGKAIPFVNISVKEEAKGTVSDNYGYFELEVDHRQRMVTISSVAYETQNFRASDLAFGKKVFMQQVSYDLPGIEIKASRLSQEEVILGLRNKRRGHSMGFASRQLGTEIGTVIPVKEKSYIQSAHFVLNHAKGDSLLFRLNLYSYDDKSIGEKLIKEDVLVMCKQKKGTISVDLSEYDLVISDYVFMSLEWIRDDGTGNEGITFDTRRSRKSKGVYFKSTSGQDFKKINYKTRYGLCFYLKGKYLKD